MAYKFIKDQGEILRKTKIICTIGPACGNESILEKLITSGMDVARINTSHSSREDVKTRISTIREISKKYEKNIAIMLDLQGPKIRIGSLENEIDLADGQEIIFSVRLLNKSRFDETHPITGPSEVIDVDYANFLEDIKDGSVIFIDDGLIECRIIRTDKDLGLAYARVIRGGILKSKKGINLPGISVSVSSITEKDLDFLQLGIDLEVDFIAQSFVRDANDVKLIKEIIKEQKSHIMVIAKIEKHEAVANFDSILKRADAIMIARGDLGIEIPPEDVPGIQKDIIKKANIAGKPVITATQMLDSMIRNPRPTRAEVSDVANAIYDGSDALMLSGETASGEFPVESLEIMARIISKTEGDLDYKEIMQKKFKLKQNTITEAISFAACEIANVLNVKAIITATQSGSTARHISKNRPECTIIGASPNDWVIRQLMISWGVNPVRTKFTENIDKMIREAVEVSREAGHVLEGEKVVITGGIMSSKPGSTDFINVWEVE
jgi:pyruvate kinase